MAGIYKLTSGGLMVNYRCQARCGHCLYFCSPEREEDYLSYEAARDIFARVKALGAPSMHISGGEPFLEPEKLTRVLDAARDEGMPIDYIETSASWAEEDGAVREVLRRVRSYGVTALSVSISPYHNEYIPLDRVLRLTGLCAEEGLDASLWIDEFLPDMSVFPTDAVHSKQEYVDFFNRNYWAQLPPRYALYRMGRAVLTHRDDMPTFPTPRIPHMGRSCAELAGRSHYHIDCYGGYIPPGCPGLALPLSALGRELEPEEYPVYTRLAQEPRQLLDYCKAQGFVPGPSYYNRCHLCQEMRLFLYQKFPGRFKELAPASFYETILQERSVEAGRGMV